MALEYTDLSSIPGSLMKFADYLSNNEQQRARNLSSAYDSLGRTTDEFLSMAGKVQDRLLKTKATADLILDIKSDFASGDYASSFMKFSVAKDLYKNNPTFKNIIDENIDISATYISISDAFQYNVALDKAGQNLVNFNAIYNNRGNVSIYEDVKKILPTIAGDEQRMGFLRFVGLPPEVVAYDQNSGTTLATPTQVKNGLLAYKGSLQTGEPYSSSYEKVSMKRFGGLPVIQGLVNEISSKKDIDPVTAYVLSKRYEQQDLQNDLAYLIGANQGDEEKVKQLSSLLPSAVRDSVISSKVAVDDKTYPVTEALGKAKVDSSFRAKLMTTVSDDYKVYTGNGLREFGIPVSPDDMALSSEISPAGTRVDLETPEGVIYQTIASGLTPNQAIARVVDLKTYDSSRDDINKIINPDIVVTEKGSRYISPEGITEPLENLSEKIPNLDVVLQDDAVLKSGITNPEFKPIERGQYLGVAIARAQQKTELDAASSIQSVNSTVAELYNNLGLNNAISVSGSIVNPRLSVMVKGILESGVKSSELRVSDPRNPENKINAATRLDEQLKQMQEDVVKLSKFSSTNRLYMQDYIDGMRNFLRGIDSKLGNKTLIKAPIPQALSYLNRSESINAE